MLWSKPEQPKETSPVTAELKVPKPLAEPQRCHSRGLLTLVEQDDISKLDLVQQQVRHVALVLLLHRVVALALLRVEHQAQAMRRRFWFALAGQQYARQLPADIAKKGNELSRQPLTRSVCREFMLSNREAASTTVTHVSSRASCVSGVSLPPSLFLLAA